MFGTRLNPIKPPAHYRAALERLGAACATYCPDRSSSMDCRTSAALFCRRVAEWGGFRIGVSTEFGGVGAEPLLVALALERAGREKLAFVNLLLLHAVAASVIERWGDGEQKRLLSRLAAGDDAVTVASSLSSNRPGADPGVSFERRSDGMAIRGACTTQVADSVRAPSILLLARESESDVGAVLIVDVRQPGVGIVRDDAAGDLSVRVEFGSGHLFQAGELGTHGDLGSITASVRMMMRFGFAAGWIGVLSRRIAAWAAGGFKERDGTDCGRVPAERVVANLAVALESIRGLVYGAAELQADFNRRPNSKHLEMEAMTLVSSAYYGALQSVKLVESMGVEEEWDDGWGKPERGWRGIEAAGFVVEPEEDLERAIAAFYLDQEPTRQLRRAVADQDGGRNITDYPAGR